VFDKNKQWLGWKGKTLLDEIGKVSGSLVGRNPAYRPIVIKGTSDFLGKTINVKVVKAFPTYLAGEILE
jgi:tRNA-2-methylthio-N6-dimethylallyladenosine synthase